MLDIMPGYGEIAVGAIFNPSLQQSPDAGLRFGCIWRSQGVIAAVPERSARHHRPGRLRHRPPICAALRQRP